MLFPTDEIRRISTAALASLAVRGVSVLLAFSAQMLLTRTLGLAEFGIFAFALAWVKGLGVAATLGSERLIVRDVSAYLVRGQWEAMRGLVRWGGRTFIGSATATASFAALAFWLAAANEYWLFVLWTALPLLPLTAAMRLAQFILAGLQRPILAQLPETVVQPLLFLIAATLVAAGRGLTAQSAVALQLSAAAMAAALGLRMLVRALPRGAAGAQPGGGAPAPWRSALVLFLATGSASLTAAMPVLLLGIMRGPADAGLMAVARSIADLTLVPILAFGAVMAPVLARLWTEGATSAVQRSFTAFARMSSLAVVPLAMTILLLREPLLNFFGHQYTGAGRALAILLVGQVFGTLAGSNALLLSTGGHERTVARISVASMFFGTLATALLIRTHGLVGAAVGSAATSILWNVALATRTHSLTGVRPGAFARVRETVGP